MLLMHTFSSFVSNSYKSHNFRNDESYKYGHTLKFLFSLLKNEKIISLECNDKWQYNYFSSKKVQIHNFTFLVKNEKWICAFDFSVS